MMLFRWLGYAGRHVEWMSLSLILLSMGFGNAKSAPASNRLTFHLFDSRGETETEWQLLELGENARFDWFNLAATPSITRDIMTCDDTGAVVVDDARLGSVFVAIKNGIPSTRAAYVKGDSGAPSSIALQLSELSRIVGSVKGVDGFPSPASVRCSLSLGGQIEEATGVRNVVLLKPPAIALNVGSTGLFETPELPIASYIVSVSANGSTRTVIVPQERLGTMVDIEVVSEVSQLKAVFVNTVVSSRQTTWTSQQAAVVVIGEFGRYRGHGQIGVPLQVNVDAREKAATVVAFTSNAIGWVTGEIESTQQDPMLLPLPEMAPTFSFEVRDESGYPIRTRLEVLSARGVESTVVYDEWAAWFNYSVGLESGEDGKCSVVVPSGGEYQFFFGDSESRCGVTEWMSLANVAGSAQKVVLPNSPEPLVVQDAVTSRPVTGSVYATVSPSGNDGSRSGGREEHFFEDGRIESYYYERWIGRRVFLAVPGYVIADLSIDRLLAHGRRIVELMPGESIRIQMPSTACPPVSFGRLEVRDALSRLVPVSCSGEDVDEAMIVGGDGVVTVDGLACGSYVFRVTPNRYSAGNECEAADRARGVSKTCVATVTNLSRSATSAVEMQWLAGEGAWVGNVTIGVK